jgi:hypothetical protein
MSDELWAKVPLYVLRDRRLTSNAVRVYAALATFGGCDAIYPSLPTLAGRAGLCPRTVQKALRQLEAFAYLTTTAGGGRGKSNEYILEDGSKARPVCVVSRDKRRGFARKTAQALAKIVQNPAVCVPETTPTVLENHAGCAHQVVKESEKGKDNLVARPTENARHLAKLAAAHALAKGKCLTDAQIDAAATRLSQMLAVGIPLPQIRAGLPTLAQELPDI